jgi:hypothetical protein
MQIRTFDAQTGNLAYLEHPDRPVRVYLWRREALFSVELRRGVGGDGKSLYLEEVQSLFREEVLGKHKIVGWTVDLARPTKKGDLPDGFLVVKLHQPCSYPVRVKGSQTLAEAASLLNDHARSLMSEIS